MLVFAAIAATIYNMMNHIKQIPQPMMSGLLIGILLLTISSGCSSASKSDVSRQVPPQTTTAKTAAPVPVAGSTVPVANEIRKVIETAQVTLETMNLAKTEKFAIDLLAKRKGKVDSANVTLDANGRRSGSYTLRIPAGQLSDYLNELAADPDVVVRQRSLSAQDVTEEFVDISARLENMKRHETRLREILAKANTVDEVLKVEKELSTVRSQIDSTTGRLKAMTGKIEMSTVQLRISEVTVITETNFFGKLKMIIRDSWVAAGDVFLYLIATVIILSPFVLIVAAIWWWRRRRMARQQSRTSAITFPPVDPPK